jgi:hypothetical protein
LSCTLPPSLGCCWLSSFVVCCSWFIISSFPPNSRT